jgi:hypothetical protein
METKCHVLCSQQLATRCYSEPYESTPCPSSFSVVQFIIIIITLHIQVIQVVSLLQSFLP